MWEFLTRVDLFGGLAPETLKLLEPGTQVRSFARGSRLFVQGGEHAALYVIVTGQVRTERRHPDIRGAVVLAELGPGEVVGAQGILDGMPCTHTAVVTDPTEAVEVPAGSMARLLAHPSARSRRLMDTFSSRLQPQGMFALGRQPLQDG